MVKLYTQTTLILTYGSVVVNLLCSINYIQAHDSSHITNSCDTIKRNYDDDDEGKVENYEDVYSEGSNSPRTGRAFPATKFLDGLLRESLFNTTMNFVMPGFHLYMPRHTEEGSVDHLAMQAFFGLFFAISWITAIAIPTMLTYFQPLGIARAGSESLYTPLVFGDHSGQGFKVKWTLNDKVAEAIGVNWTSCVQKTVCQAYEHPEKYGRLGEAVRLLFPHTNVIMVCSVPKEYETHGSDDDVNYIDKAENESVKRDCSHVYRCFFDVLDVLLYVNNYCMLTYQNWN